MNPEWIKSLLQLSPLWSLFLLAFIPLSAKVLNKNKELKAEIVISIYAMAILSSVLLFAFVGFSNREVFLLKFDSYSSQACLLVGLAGALALPLFYLNQWLDRKQLTEILFLFCLGLGGLYVLCLAQDLMTAFIGLETASLTLYINLAMSRKDPFCLEAALKYFILSTFSGVVFLYGLSFLMGSTGSLNFSSFVQSENLQLYNRFFFLGWALIFSSLFFKIAIFPFHFWLADVYQGALTPITAFLATAVKSALVLFVGKIFSLGFFEKGAHGFAFLNGLALVSVLTVVFGNVMALKQTKLKRWAAFSSLAHSGYLMMALFGVLNLESSAQDFSSIIYYLLAYIILTSGLFLLIQMLETSSSQPEMKELRGLVKTQPLLAFSLGLLLMGLAGLPPSFGFFAKLGIFQPLVLSGNWWVLFWAFVGSSLGLFYYMRAFVLMLDCKTQASPLSVPWFAKWLLVALSVSSLLGSFLFGFILH